MAKRTRLVPSYKYYTLYGPQGINIAIRGKPSGSMSFDKNCYKAQSHVQTSGTHLYTHK